MNLFIILIILIIIFLIIYNLIQKYDLFQNVSTVSSVTEKESINDSTGIENVFHIKKNVFYNINDNCSNGTSSNYISCISDLKKINDLDLEKGNFIVNVPNDNDNDNNIFTINKLCLNGTCFNNTDISKLKSDNRIEYAYSQEDIDNEVFKGSTVMPRIRYTSEESSILSKICFGSDSCIDKSHIDILLGKIGLNLETGSEPDNFILPYNIEFGWRGLGFTDVMKHLFYKTKNKDCEFKNNFNCFADPWRHQCDTTSDNKLDKSNNFRIYPSTTKDGIIPDDNSYTHIHD